MRGMLVLKAAVRNASPDNPARGRLVAAGLLTCGSSPFSSLPGTFGSSGPDPTGVEAARRLQLRGQFRYWTQQVRTGFPLSCDT